MSNIEISGSIDPSTRSYRTGASTPTALNTALGYALVLMIALAPLPFGSNRPIFWTVWALYLGIVSVVYFVALAMRGEKLRANPTATFIPAALFIVTCLYLIVQLIPLGVFITPLADGAPVVTAQISLAPNMTVFMLVRQLTFGLLFLLMMQVAVNDKRRVLMLNLILLSVIAYGLLGIFNLQAGDTILGLAKWAYIGSATGPFVNRNSFATFLGFGAIIALANVATLVIKQFQRHPHDGTIRNFGSSVLLYLIAYGFLVCVIIASQSRMGLFSTLIGSSVVVVLTFVAVRGWKLAIFVIPVGILIIGAGLVLFGQGLFERVGSVEFSAEQRGNLYRQVVELISLRPWTGFGGGSFELAFPIVHARPVSTDLIWDKAHDTYLALWAELGLVFGSLPIIAIGLLGYRMLSGIVRKNGSWTAQAIGLGVLVLGAVHSLADFSLEIQGDTFLFIALIATGVATSANPSGRGQGE